MLLDNVRILSQFVNHMILEEVSIDMFLETKLFHLYSHLCDILNNDKFFE